MNLLKLLKHRLQERTKDVWTARREVAKNRTTWWAKYVNFFCNSYVLWDHACDFCPWLNAVFPFSIVYTNHRSSHTMHRCRINRNHKNQAYLPYYNIIYVLYSEPSFCDHFFPIDCDGILLSFVFCVGRQLFDSIDFVTERFASRMFRGCSASRFSLSTFPVSPIQYWENAAIHKAGSIFTMWSIKLFFMISECKLDGIFYMNPWHPFFHNWM